MLIFLGLANIYFLMINLIGILVRQLRLRNLVLKR